VQGVRKYKLELAIVRSGLGFGIGLGLELKGKYTAILKSATLAFYINSCLKSIYL